MKILGAQPTLIIAVVSQAIILLGTFQFRLLTGDQAALIVVAINAIAGAINAYTVRPVAPAAFTYAVGAIAAVVGSYGFGLTPEQLAGVNGVVIAVLGLLTYGNVSPVETAISKSTLEPWASNDPIDESDLVPSRP